MYVIINREAAEIDNHVSRDNSFDYHPLRECDTYLIIHEPNIIPLFFTFSLLGNTMHKHFNTNE